MRHWTITVATALVALALLTAPAAADLVSFAIGAYGGMNLPLEDDSSSGTVIGAKLRVLPPIPLVGFEAWYAQFGYEDPGEVLAQGDLSLALEGDNFKLWGVDALIGSVRGVPGFKWYGIVGVNAAEFEEFGKDEKERKLGGEVGLGVEITPPALSLGIEGRSTLMFPDISGDFDEKLLTVTVGVNYYF
jgi:hypothetical protein